MSLSGAELINVLSLLPANASKSDRCRAAGYVSVLKSGKERLNFTAFYQALATAQGINLAAPEHGTQQSRRLSYRTKTGKPGAVLGASYLRQIGAKPGDVLRIQVQDSAQIIVSIAKSE